MWVPVRAKGMPVGESCAEQRRGEAWRNLGPRIGPRDQSGTQEKRVAGPGRGRGWADEERGEKRRVAGVGQAGGRGERRPRE